MNKLPFRTFAQTMASKQNKMENNETTRILDPAVASGSSCINQPQNALDKCKDHERQPEKESRKDTEKQDFSDKVGLGTCLKQQVGEIHKLKEDFKEMSLKHCEDQEQLNTVKSDLKRLGLRWRILGAETRALTCEYASLAVADKDSCEGLNLFNSELTSQSEVTARLETSERNLTEQLSKHEEETRAQLRVMGSQHTEKRNDFMEYFRKAEERLNAKLDQTTHVKTTVSDEVPSPPPESSSWWSLSSVKKYATYGLACVAVTAVAYGVVKACMK